MILRFLGCLALLFLLACGGPATEFQVPQKTEPIVSAPKAAAPMPATYKQACEDLNGQWEALDNFTLGPNVTAHLGTHICNLPSKDAQKVCTSRFSCSGRCINSDSQTGIGYCSAGWLARKIDVLFPWKQRRGIPGEPPAIPDVLYAEKIERVKNYVMNRYLWETRKPESFSYVYDFDGGLVVSANSLPARLTIKNEKLVSAHYVGEDALRPDGDPPINHGDEISWRGSEPMSFHFSELHRSISYSMIGDTFNVTYHPDYGHPVFIELDSKKMSDSYSLTEFRGLRIVEPR